MTDERVRELLDLATAFGLSKVYGQLRDDRLEMESAAGQAVATAIKQFDPSRSDDIEGLVRVRMLDQLRTLIRRHKRCGFSDRGRGPGETLRNDPNNRRSTRLLTRHEMHPNLLPPRPERVTWSEEEWESVLGCFPPEMHRERYIVERVFRYGEYQSAAGAAIGVKLTRSNQLFWAGIAYLRSNLSNENYR